MNTDTFEQIMNAVVVVVGGLSLLVPVLQYIVKQTATKTDDEWVEKFATFLHDLLAYLPVLRLGRTLGQKELIESVPAKVLEPQPASRRDKDA